MDSPVNAENKFESLTSQKHIWWHQRRVSDLLHRLKRRCRRSRETIVDSPGKCWRKSRDILAKSPGKKSVIFSFTSNNFLVKVANVFAESSGKNFLKVPGKEVKDSREKNFTFFSFLEARCFDTGDMYTYIQYFGIKNAVWDG
jgi:hypothetical protein